MRQRQYNVLEMACSHGGSTIAVAESEGFVQTWNLESLQKIAAFETTLDFGGRRLAISPDSKHCVVGAYHVHGISLYDANNGTEIWRRKDLKKVQNISISEDGLLIFCGFEGKSFQLLNLKTGDSEKTIRGVRYTLESIYDEVMVIDRKGRDFKLVDANSKQICVIPRTTFAALGFAFAPQKLCVSESTGSIRCYDTASGQQLWEFNPGSGKHALNLTYDESNEVFAAITWSYERGGEYQLVTLQPGTGEAVTIAAITGTSEFAFCKRGASLLSSDGKLRKTSTGEIIGELKFFP